MVVCIGKITSQEILTDNDCALDSAKSVSSSRTGSHGRDGVVIFGKTLLLFLLCFSLLVLISRFPTNELRVVTNA